MFSPLIGAGEDISFCIRAKECGIDCYVDPQIALGQSQSSILANAYFENDVLDLVNVFIPPLMSSTMNENILNRVKGGQGGEAKPNGEEKSAGRKELPDDQKSEKTIKNLEAQG